MNSFISLLNCGLTKMFEFVSLHPSVRKYKEYKQMRDYYSQFPLPTNFDINSDILNSLRCDISPLSCKSFENIDINHYRRCFLNN